MKAPKSRKIRNLSFKNKAIFKLKCVAPWPRSGEGAVQNLKIARWRSALKILNGGLKAGAARKSQNE